MKGTHMVKLVFNPPTKAPGRDWPTRVLIVEDNGDAADTLRALLESIGYDVATAYNGESALNAARTFEPDVVLCDIGLPGEVNGYDVARSLRASGQRAFLVAVTGFGRAQDIRQAHEAGFDAHLTKPMRLAQLEDLLKSAKQRRAADMG
jgi:CheY-like chemotaxis protein